MQCTCEGSLRAPLRTASKGRGFGVWPRSVPARPRREKRDGEPQSRKAARRESAGAVSLHPLSHLAAWRLLSLALGLRGGVPTATRATKRKEKRRFRLLPCSFRRPDRPVRGRSFAVYSSLTAVSAASGARGAAGDGYRSSSAPPSTMTLSFLYAGQTRARRDETTHDDVLLETAQVVDLAADRRLGEHLRRLLEGRWR